MPNSPYDLNHVAELHRRHGLRPGRINEEGSPYDLSRVREIEDLANENREENEKPPEGSPYDLDYQARLDRWFRNRRR